MGYMHCTECAERAKRRKMDKALYKIRTGKVDVNAKSQAVKSSAKEISDLETQRENGGK